MCASPISLLRAGPPPPKVVLLPDALFFSRSVSITAGATAAEAASQVELALEAISPFPLTQLYYGWHWVPGSERAFVYAAYRRRFTADQVASWAGAELVIPASAALFGGEVQPATTLVLTEENGITGVHWESPGTPAKVVFKPFLPEGTDEERAKTRDELLRSLGGSKVVVDLMVLPAPDPAGSDGDIVFRSGDFVSRLRHEMAGAFDVRDKGELAALRAARKRDIMLWRVALGCAAALVLFGILELALIGGHAWQKTREVQLAARAPAVQKIREAQDLASSIQDLVTKRFLPLEMVTSVIGTNADRKPGDILVTRIQSSTSSSAKGLYTLVMELQTTNPAQVPVYRTELRKLPECEDAVVEPLPSQGDRSLFRMTVTFKPGALKPEAS